MERRRGRISDWSTKNQLCFDLISLTHEYVDEKVERTIGHVQTRRIGEVRIEVVKRAGGVQPIGELLVHGLGRMRPVTANGRELGEQRGAVEEDRGLLELDRALCRLDAV